MGISKSDFKFTEPVGTAPRRVRTLSGHSPNKASHSFPLSQVSLVSSLFYYGGCCSGFQRMLAHCMALNWLLVQPRYELADVSFESLLHWR